MTTETFFREHNLRHFYDYSPKLSIGKDKQLFPFAIYHLTKRSAHMRTLFDKDFTEQKPFDKCPEIWLLREDVIDTENYPFMWVWCFLNGVKLPTPETIEEIISGYHYIKYFGASHSLIKKTLDARAREITPEMLEVKKFYEEIATAEYKNRICSGFRRYFANKPSFNFVVESEIFQFHRNSIFENPAKMRIWTQAYDQYSTDHRVTFRQFIIKQIFDMLYLGNVNYEYFIFIRFITILSEEERRYLRTQSFTADQKRLIDRAPLMFRML